MFIFLDESGDLGFDFKEKSPTNNFSITLLVCKNYASVKLFQKSISRTLKNKINHKANKKTIKNELKGSETTIAIKKYFFGQVIDNADWDIYCILLNKRELIQKLDKPPVHKNIYNNCARQILEKVDFNHSTLQNVNLVIDRSKNSKEIIEFNRYVADHLAGLLAPNTNLIIQHQTSTENTGLQSVDLFSWGIFKKHESQDENWYQFFKDRIKVELKI